MPYEYRSMSPEERAAVVAHRREHGYPLHAPPHPCREGGWYLHSPDRRDEFEAHLLEAFRSIGADIGGWIVLPNHYHILVGVDSLDPVSRLLKQLHGTTSRLWNRADGTTGQRRVWYKFTDRRIRGVRHYYQALNYIHYNPVKHGHTSAPYA